MMDSKPAYLVEILLPTRTGKGKAIGRHWFERLVGELTEKYGGATSFVRAPGEGLWQNGGETEHDNIAVIEVMTGSIDPAYWGKLRARLEKELSQEEIVVRCQQIRRL
jgi:hypothetical protein